MFVELSSHVDADEWNRQAADLGAGYFHTVTEPACLAMAAGSEPLFLRGRDAAGRVVALATGVLWRPRVWPMSRYCGQATLLGVPAIGADCGVDTAAVLQAIELRLRAAGVFALRVDSYDSPGSDAVLGPLGYQLGERWEFVIDFSDRDRDLWDALAGERRTDIRRAEKLGVHTRCEQTSDAIALVAQFQRESMERRGQPIADATRQTEAVGQRVSRGMGDIFVTYCDGQPVNAALLMYFNARAYYHMAGTSEAGKRCRGPVHLVWTALQHYAERGAECLNLGAALGGQESLYQFKRDFGAHVLPAPTGCKKIATVGSVLDQVRSLLGR